MPRPVVPWTRASLFRDIRLGAVYSHLAERGRDEDEIMQRHWQRLVGPGLAPSPCVRKTPAFFVAAFLALLPARAVAQDDVITLAKAIELGRRHSFNLKASRAQADSADANVDSA